MAATQNYRDIQLQLPGTTRTVVTGTNYIRLSALQTYFRVSEAGDPNPVSLDITANLVGIISGQTVTFSVDSGTANITQSNNVCNITYSNMTSDNVTIKASLTHLGVLYEARISLTKLFDGKNATNSVVLDLLQDKDIVPTSSTGTGYVLPVGNVLRVYNNGVLLTPPEVTFGGTATKNGLTAAIDVNGNISLSAINWTTDTETFTFTATYALTTYSIAYSITKAKAGQNSIVYNIYTSSPVLTKDASDAATAGTYSSITIQGKKIDGNTTTNYGWVTVTGNGDTEATTATNTATTPVTLSPATTAGKTSYTIKLYNQAAISGATLLDTQVVNVVFRGVNGVIGTSAPQVILSNEAHSFSCASDGSVLSYLNSGTQIRVYEGSVLLPYDGVGTSVTTNGTWKINSNVTTATNITVGTITDSGDYATIADHSGVASGVDSSIITYTILGKTASGTAFTLVKSQTFSKSKSGTAGSSPVIYDIETNTEVITKDAPDAATSGGYSTFTVQGRKYEGNTTSNYGWVTITANGDTEATTATNTATGPVTKTTLDTAGKSYYTIKLYNQATVSGATLLDTQQINVVFKGATGSPGAAAQYCTLSVDKQAISYAADGTTPSPTSITFTATATNITTPYYEYIIAGTTQPNTNNSPNLTYTVPTNFTSMPQQVKLNIRSGSSTGTIVASDTLSLIGIKPGTNGTPGNPGTSAISGLLTNESHTIAADSAGTVTSANLLLAGGTFKVWDGTTEKTGTAVTYSVVGTPSNITISIDTAGNYSISALTADIATATLRAVYSGVTIDKVYSITKAKSGTNAIVAVLSNETHVFPCDSIGSVNTYNGSGTEIRVYEGTSLLLYDGVGTSSGTWKISTSVGTNITPGTATDSGDYATIGIHSGVANTSDISSILYTISGKNSVGTAFTILKTQTFSKSKAGSDSILVDLVSESDTISANNDGTYTSTEITNITNALKLYKGGVQINNATQYSGSISTTATTTTITGLSTTANMLPGQVLTKVSGTGTFGGTATIVSVDGPTQITISTTSANTTGAIVFTIAMVSYAGTATSNGLTLTINSSTGVITLSGTAWTANSATFTLTATYNSIVYSAMYSIVKSKAGSNGVSIQGPRGSVRLQGTATSWTDTAANAVLTNAGYTTKVLGDIVTLTNSTSFTLTKFWDGTAWTILNEYIDGNLLVNGSVTASKINSNGLAIKDAYGNTVLSSAVPLDWDYVTRVNLNLVPGIGTWGRDNINGLSVLTTNVTYAENGVVAKILDGYNDSKFNSPVLDLTQYTSYTFSFIATSTVAGKTIVADVTAGGATLIASSSTLTTGAVQYVYNWTISDAARSASVVRLYTSAGTGDVRIYNIKLEQGNRRTSYSPNRVDTVSINNVINSNNIGTYISDASIKNAQIANATIEYGKIKSVDAASITTGTLDAARIAANSITASKINSNGLSIKDPYGNIILASGSSLDWDYIKRVNTNLVPSMAIWSKGSGTSVAYTSASYSENGIVGIISSGYNWSALTSPSINLSSYTSFTVSFIAYSTAAGRTLYVDLFPDDLPESTVALTTSPTVYEFQWSTTSANRASCQLRFFADTLPGDVYIFAVKLEAGSTRTNYVDNRVDTVGANNALTSSNIGNYMASGTISTTFISDLAVNTLKLGYYSVSSSLYTSGGSVTFTMQPYSQALVSCILKTNLAQIETSNGATAMPLNISGDHTATYYPATAFSSVVWTGSVYRQMADTTVTFIIYNNTAGDQSKTIYASSPYGGVAGYYWSVNILKR